MEAHVTVRHAEAVGPQSIKAGCLYITARGFIAYAASPSVLVIFNDPSASIVNPSSYPENNKHFPMRLASVGTSVTLEQSA